jgi:hypothetical protein
MFMLQILYSLFLNIYYYTEHHLSPKVWKKHLAFEVKKNWWILESIATAIFSTTWNKKEDAKRHLFSSLSSNHFFKKVFHVPCFLQLPFILTSLLNQICNSKLNRFPFFSTLTQVLKSTGSDWSFLYKPLFHWPMKIVCLWSFV